MKYISRRDFIALITTGAITLAAAKKIYAKNIFNNIKINKIEKQKNKEKNNKENYQNLNNIPYEDKGTLPNLKFSFKDAHIRNESGGWTRQITQRELAVAKKIAGVNMRLKNQGIRELHWHKEAEWSYMLYGKARITALDQNGKYFIEDIKEGDLWYFPSGIPHSIQGLKPNGCEFILAFDNGNFDEDSTFLLSDWFKHIPIDILAKNFNAPIEIFNCIPSINKKYIFNGSDPGKLNKNLNGEISKKIFIHRMSSQKAIKTKKGQVKIVDSSIFKISKKISAALVELEKGAIRELHWHPNNDEWQYYISGHGRMGVFASSDKARTFNFKKGDVGYIPFAMGHYIENLGNKPLKFLELFRSNYYADISLNQWLSLTPKNLINDHLNLNKKFLELLNNKKTPII